VCNGLLKHILHAVGRVIEANVGKCSLDIGIIALIHSIYEEGNTLPSIRTSSGDIGRASLETMVGCAMYSNNLVHGGSAATIEEAIPEDCIMDLHSLVPGSRSHRLWFERHKGSTPVLCTRGGGDCRCM
jgi:hypothetical protein